MYVATINGKLAGFISLLHFPHPLVKNMKKVHRLVVLPDFQGCGVGGRLLDTIGSFCWRDGYRLGITTSSPALAFGLRGNSLWRCARVGRTARGGKTSTRTVNSSQHISSSRTTTGWEYNPLN